MKTIKLYLWELSTAAAEATTTSSSSSSSKAFKFHVVRVSLDLDHFSAIAPLFIPIVVAVAVIFYPPFSPIFCLLFFFPFRLRDAELLLFYLWIAFRQPNKATSFRIASRIFSQTFHHLNHLEEWMRVTCQCWLTLALSLSLNKEQFAVVSFFLLPVKWIDAKGKSASVPFERFLFWFRQLEIYAGLK